MNDDHKPGEWSAPGLYHAKETRNHRLTGRQPSQGTPEAWRTDRCPAQYVSPLEAASPFEPLPELARQGDWDQPRISLHAGQRGARALRTHPPSDAEDPRSGGLPLSLQTGGIDMNNTGDSSLFDGNLEPSHGVTLEGRAIPFESGVLPLDFPQRLTRLKEASGLTWSGLSRALGCGPQADVPLAPRHRTLRRSHALPVPLRQPDARRPGHPHGRGSSDELPEGLTRLVSHGNKQVRKSPALHPNRPRRRLIPLNRKEKLAIQRLTGRPVFRW